mmetsp:Transcript_43338/g.140557  ORF Transcript_43338/g.140557 Transcript_43338/m.140557 type:complete len:275 (-) Transcript_43338:328-1152(-)
MGAALRRWSFGCTTCGGRGRFRAASGTRLRRGSGECSQSGWAKSRGVARTRACPQVVKMPTELPASVRCSSSASHWGGWPLAAGSRRQGVARFLAAVASTSILRVWTRPRWTGSMQSTPNHIVLWFSAAGGRSCGSMRRRTRRLCLCAPQPRRLSTDIEPLRVLFSSGHLKPPSPAPPRSPAPASAAPLTPNLPSPRSLPPEPGHSDLAAQLQLFSQALESDPGCIVAWDLAIWNEAADAQWEAAAALAHVAARWIPVHACAWRSAESAASTIS